MSMVKVVAAAGWDWDVPVASMMKVANNGRFGANDLLAFTKRAGSAETANIFAKELENIKFGQDTIPVHLIALGAKEAYGPNRNGDAFSEAALKRAHNTFVKYAFWFRNHKNKPHEGHPKFGYVKASAYNQKMRRVELLCALPTTKKAAEELGWDIQVADKEYEKLARGEDIAVSMACRVPYDVCSGCNNKARTREEYCKEANCKYGGCYNNLTKLIKVANDAHILHVDNPEPCFFDISNVWRPADRIAYAGRADWVKAASDGFFGIDGAKTAADVGVTAPSNVILYQDVNVPAARREELEHMLKLASGIAMYEQQPKVWSHAALQQAFAVTMQPPLDLDALGLPAAKPEKTAAVLGALADNKIVMPLRDFARMTKRAEWSTEAAAQLDGIYSRMLSNGSFPQALHESPYLPTRAMAPAAQRSLANRLSADYGLEKDAVDRRCTQAVLRSHAAPVINVYKDAAPPAEKLAQDYACYQLAALHHIAEFDKDFQTTVGFVLTQNQVS